MRVFEKQLTEGAAYRFLPRRRKKLEFAQTAIQLMLNTVPRAYVGISFGKQSLCLAHMVYRIDPTVPMHFLASDETWSMYDYAAVIEQFCERWPINLTIHQTHRFTNAPSWKAARDAGDSDLQNMVPRNTSDGWFWGLACEEAPEREKTLMAGYRHDTPHPSIFKYRDGKFRCCPLMHWETIDLAAYIGEHDIPLLSIYQRYGLHQRTTARVTKKMLRNQGMTLCRMTNSAGFRELVNRFPEINIQ